MKFAKPPLIELIAEFRWLPTTPDGQQVTNPAAFLYSGPQTEGSYDAFRQTVAKNGYTLSERLIPHGFPYPMHQPVFRFSRPREGSVPSSSILQIGVGLLSVHALPPYEDWDSFKPVISQALDALINSRAPETGVGKFIGVSLRYIDVFGPELMRNRSQRNFLSEVLQIKIALPDSFVTQVREPDAVIVATQLKARIKSGLDLTLSVGPNVSEADPQRVVMDTNVSSPEPVDCDRNSVLDVLERAHTCIRLLFFGMTTSIHELMELRSEKVGE